MKSDASIASVVICPSDVNEALEENKITIRQAKRGESGLVTVSEEAAWQWARRIFN